MQQGHFVAIEGPDGTGKSTLIPLLRSAVEAAGREVVSVREPGGTPLAEQARDLCLNYLDRGRRLSEDRALLEPAFGLWTGEELTPRALAAFRSYLRALPDTEEGKNGIVELLLMCVARQDLVQRVIRPALTAGHVVLADRYTLSTAVYQGVLRGVSREVIDRINDRATLGVRPHLTLVLDVEPQVASLRRAKRGADDVMESGNPWHVMREAYRSAVAEDPTHFLKIDANGSPSDTFASAWKVLEPLVKANVGNRVGAPPLRGGSTR